MKKEEMQALAKRAQATLLKYRYVVIVLLAGILLLCMGGRETKPQPECSQEGQAVFDLETFEQDAAARLSRIDGVGKLELMLTLESTGEAVYASDTRESANGTQSTSRERSVTVVSESGYGQRPVTVKELYPTFRGAVVLCEGADNVQVRCAVVEAVSTMCGIGADKVAVLKMGSAE